jgi:hypothetical protein
MFDAGTSTMTNRFTALTMMLSDKKRQRGLNGDKDIWLVAAKSHLGICR